VTSPIGSRITELREQRGLSKAEVGRRTGMSRPNIVRLERGVHAVRLETLETVARALGCRVTEIVSVLDEVRT
jgi:transcriptional regulator with XRE-family HTH domain